MIAFQNIMTGRYFAGFTTSQVRRESTWVVRLADSLPYSQAADEARIRKELSPIAVRTVTYSSRIDHPTNQADGVAQPSNGTVDAFGGEDGSP